MNTHHTPDQRASELVKAMTLDQKIQMLHQQLGDAAGSYGAAGYVPGIASLCVPALVLNDAGSGLADEQAGVTAYPAAIAQASSWDPATVRKVGASLGKEAFDKGVDVLLAPDVNIARVPLNGRTSEAFGEDPYLSGRTGVAYIDGVQSQHVIATVKHFDANNQEANRSAVDEKISQRALAEIYQPAFAAAVQKGHVGAAMCSYNKVNGAYACQNKPLLRHDLDGRMGFPGFVMSDWGATHSTVPAARNGLDMEMSIAQQPDSLSGSGAMGSGGTNYAEDYFGAPLKSAVQSGSVSMTVLNNMVHRVLRSMFAIGVFEHPAATEPGGYPTDVDTAANRNVALDSAEAGSVLLKNAKQALPISGHGKTIALIGMDAGAGTPTVSEAGGSVHVNQPDTVTPLQGLTARAAKAGDTLAYNDGDDIQAAVALAKRSDVAVVYAGYVESEGVDRTSLDYDEGGCDLKCASEPSNADALISAVAAANPRTIVVLNTGGPAVMPWLNQVRAVLEMWYPGEEDGDAASALLFGDVDPGGKLPITFPKSLSQLPTQTAKQYPGVDGTAVYSEGLLVGYRWYDAKHITPLFPFGYGLSYTRFRFSAVHLARHGSSDTVTYTITNTGHRTGADVAQVYVRDPAAAGEPPVQLKGYRKTTLRAGQSARETIRLPRSAFRYWNVKSSSWKVAPGRYTISVGGSSANRPLAATLTR
jgi:beta-glucosidase